MAPAPAREDPEEGQHDGGGSAKARMMRAEQGTEGEHVCQAGLSIGHPKRFAIPFTPLAQVGPKELSYRLATIGPERDSLDILLYERSSGLADGQGSASASSVNRVSL